MKHCRRAHGREELWSCSDERNVIEWASPLSKMSHVANQTSRLLRNSFTCAVDGYVWLWLVLIEPAGDDDNDCQAFVEAERHKELRLCVWVIFSTSGAERRTGQFVWMSLPVPIYHCLFVFPLCVCVFPLTHSIHLFCDDCSAVVAQEDMHETLALVGLEGLPGHLSHINNLRVEWAAVQLRLK